MAWMGKLSTVVRFVWPWLVTGDRRINTIPVVAAEGTAVVGVVVAMTAAHDTIEGHHHGGDLDRGHHVDGRLVVGRDHQDTTGGRSRHHRRVSNRSHRQEVCLVVGPEVRPNPPPDHRVEKC